MTRGRALALGLAVAMLAGVLAPGAATATTPYVGVDVEVTVWRALDDDGDLYVGARDTGGLWRRHPAALDLSATSASGRFHRSEAVALTVPLAGFGEAVVEAVVWRSVSDPSRLHLSVRRAGRGERWRTVNEPLAMRAHEPLEWQRYERADPVTVRVPVAPPPSAPVTTSVAGPLAVFTVPVGETWSDATGWWATREVYMLDTATDGYWRAFAYQDEYTSWVGMAGTNLVVANARQVRRIGLDGRDETVLFRGEDIGGIVVSPDGAKVAVLQDDGVLTVLDVDTGRTLLRRAALAAALLPDASSPVFALAGWNASSDRIAVAATGYERTRTGLFTLEGALQLLPPNAGNLSPDFRYAIQPHGEMNGNLLRAVMPQYLDDWPWQWGWVWGGFDVIETASGRTVRTATATDDTFFLPGPRPFRSDWQWPAWWPGAERFSWFEMGRRYPGTCGYDLREEQPPAEGAVTASHSCADPKWIASRDAAAWEAGRAWEDSTVVGPRILDVASGEVRELAQPEWRRVLTDATRLIARGGCWRNEDGQECSLFHEGRPVWNGAVEAVGVIELDEPLRYGPLLLHSALRPRPATHASAPAREEMVGPLFAWSAAGGYETEVDSAGTRLFHEQRRIVVHDAGTGRSWRVHDYRFQQREQVWSAHGGFVVWSGDALRYVTPDGQARTLLVDDRAMNVRRSPSGGKVIVTLGPESYRSSDVTLAVFALPSGEELLRVESTEPRFEKIPEGFNFSDPFLATPDAIVPLGWNAGETAFSIACGDCPGPFGTLGLGDGELTVLPPETLDRGSIPADDDAALSPDFRYVATGRDMLAESGWTWDVIDIVEVASGQIVRTVPVGELSGAVIGSDDWGWTDGRFAWSPDDAYDFRRGRIAEGGEDGEVWLLNVETGATERLTARAYAERRSPTASPAVEFPDFDASCPGSADPIQWCAVLLDGEVVGEGRWAETIGFVALD